MKWHEMWMKCKCKKRVVAFGEKFNAVIVLLTALLNEIIIKLREEEVSLKGCNIIVKM